MLPEILAVLAGHESSLFTKTGDDLVLSEAFAPLLHPGEKSAITSLARLASLYSKVREFARSPPYPQNEYICALCSALSAELREYDALVIRTEALILAKDDSLVGSGSFVPLSALVATFSEWDAPLSALSSLVSEIRAGPPGERRAKDWPPGLLIDLIHRRSQTGYSRLSAILTRLLYSLQRILLHHLTSYLLHGLPLLPNSIPSCVSQEAKESITYVGEAVATVKKEGWDKTLPREMVTDFTMRLSKVSVSDTQAFDKLIAAIRVGVSEWLWTNVLTKEDVVIAIDALADYFLLRNGEFAVSLIRELERLKAARLKSRMALIRVQDLNHALLRSSLGTTAELDPSLPKIMFALPSGPLRPFLPSLAKSTVSFSNPSSVPDFASLVLGTPLHLTYPLDFPLSLFLTPSALQTYTHLHAYLSAIRRSHLLLLDLWSSLSSAQRRRRKWVRLGEGGQGGESGEQGERTRILRKTWGCVREMVWFLEVLWGYIGGDVVDKGYRSFREQLGASTRNRTLSMSRSQTAPSPTPTSRPQSPVQSSKLDFTTLRLLHTTYLANLTSASLIASLPLSSVIFDILQTCERLVAQVERWGGDVLPDLLGATDEGSGAMPERRRIVDEIYEIFSDHLHTFYSLLATSPLPPLGSAHADASTFINGSSIMNATIHSMNSAGPSVQARRQVEHLMLKLDFNAGFSGPRRTDPDQAEPVILEGLAS